MDTYVVRIYRPSAGASQLVVGVVEPAGSQVVYRFSNFAELREILCRESGSESQGAGKAEKTGRGAKAKGKAGGGPSAGPGTQKTAAGSREAPARPAKREVARGNRAVSGKTGLRAD